MNDPVRADLFVEDRAQEAFVGALVQRIAFDEGASLTMQVRSARGGVSRVLREFRTFQALIEKGAFAGEVPDLLIVTVDGNCSTFPKKRSEIRRATRSGLRGRLVAACPDPHIERWYLADPDSFHRVVDHRPAVGRDKCERGHYKRLLAEAIRRGGHPATLDGIEFASDLAVEMDLCRAGKSDASLKAFIDELQAKVRSLAR